MPRLVIVSYITKRHTFETIKDTLLNVTPIFQQLY